MNHMPKKSCIAVLLLLTAFAAPGLGQNPAIDYLGFAWETGGFLPSESGDILWMTGTAGAIDPVFGIDLGVQEVTFYMYDLVSQGEVNVGGNNVMINYAGGYLDIYRDAAMNADWGVYPPNATSPGTFVDGTLMFRGAFTYLTVFVNLVGNGAYEGALDGIDGEILSEVCYDCAYTWGGTFLKGTGAQIPDGYDLQVDGLFELDGAIADEISTWGGVKSLYGN
ncbi:hypothetical protein KKG45_10865 [bacterium]|nr:hypothetical protein [bacterium]MBU1073737.1 hypothetical protein [bacterium]MBU1674635.1 hypothetical protein [bacterium]